MIIREVTADDPRVLDLVRAHSVFCSENTPVGSGHAVSETSPDLARIRYWIAEDRERVLGCIGLRSLDPDTAEIKTMHVRAEARGHGVGAALVACVIEAAKAQGIGSLLLETGKSEAFAASRRLYERMGFHACEPYGEYTHDPFSYCMSRSI